jgi:hypothetical protein
MDNMTSMTLPIHFQNVLSKNVWTYDITCRTFKERVDSDLVLSVDKAARSAIFERTGIRKHYQDITLRAVYHDESVLSEQEPDDLERTATFIWGLHNRTIKGHFEVDYEDTTPPNKPSEPSEPSPPSTVGSKSN